MLAITAANKIKEKEKANEIKEVVIRDINGDEPDEEDDQRLLLNESALIRRGEKSELKLYDVRVEEE